VDARSSVAQLLAQGEQLERDVAGLMKPRDRKVVGQFGRAAARELSLPPLAQTVSGLFFDGKLKERQAELEARCNALYTQARSVLGQVSVYKPSIKIGGNSAELVRQLAKANDGVKLLTRIRNLNRVLRRLSEADLVYNAHIPARIKEEQIRTWHEERERRALRYVDLSDLPPGFVSIKFPNREALLSRLGGYPAVREIMEGAIHAASGDAPDGRQQALGSCRRALEALGRELTGKGDWREIVLRVADPDVGALLRKLYSLLSAKGAHGGKRASEADVELGMQQTFGALFWMIEHRTSLGSRR